MALPPLLVKIGADTKDLDKGLGVAGARLAKFAAAGVAAASAVGIAMVALTKQSMAQIDAQAKLAQSMGTTVRSMQTLEQAGKLAGVAMSGVQQATGDLTRRLAQAASGTGPVAAALDRLKLSAVELGEVPLDERVLKINEALDAMVPAAERAAVAGQLFGEEGSLAMSRIDTATIRLAREDILRFGVAVSEVGANQVEAANDAVTRLGLVFTGFGNQLATIAAPAVERFATGLIDLADAFVGANVALEDFLGNQARARAILGEDVFNALNGNTRAVMENEAALSELATVLGILQGPLLSTGNALSAFADELRRTGATEAEAEMMALVDQIDALDFQLQNGGLSLSEYETAMNGVIDRAESLLGSLRDVSKVGYSQAISNLGDLRTALQLAAQDAFNLVSNLPGGAVSMQSGPSSRRGTRAGTNFATPGLAPSEKTINPKSREEGRFNEFFGAADTGGGGGGGGGGLQDEFARRLEIIMEGLQTERETVQAWYDEGRELLEQATDAELAAIGGKHEAIQRLEQEHQQRLFAIQDNANSQRLKDVAGFFGAMANVTKAGGEKTLKATQILAAGQGLINSYLAFTEVLKDPSLVGRPFARISAAAGVLASGLNMVRAIKGVNSSGGSVASSGGGGSSAASAPAQAPAQQNVQTLNFSVVNDPFGISDRVVRQIVGAINESQRNGSNLIRATVS